MTATITAPTATAPTATAATAATATGLDRLRRRLRVPVFTAATVTLGIGAHLAAGGVAPSTSLLALITAVVTALCAATAGRELRLPALLGAVALTEAGIHVALLGESHAVHAAADRSGSTAMLLTHVAASVLLAWWLRRGEAAVWRAVERAGSLFALGTAGPSLQLPRAFRPRTGIRPRPLRRLHVGPVHPVRGPPCVA